MNYRKFIETRLRIITSKGQEIPFLLNPIQDKFMSNGLSDRAIILKARQQGFSSLILAIFTADFLLLDNSVSVVVADNADNAIALLERVKFYLASYEDITGVQVPLKYNSKYELHNENTNSKYIIGTAENTEFGRSRTITNLHLSEAAFYPHFSKLLASAGTAAAMGRIIIETTANGFNEFKTFWENSKLGATGFTPLFYRASDFYTQEELEREKQRLGREFVQEYPETDMEAFLTSGASFFNKEALILYDQKTKVPITYDLVY